jgi:myo-inositol-1(or 4)-monophosphatase
MVGTGFSYSAERRVWQAGIVQQLIGQVRDIRRMGSAELDLCSVACGRLDAYYERGLNPWDHAAGALIAEEAGASVGGLNGAPASRDFTLATAAGLFGPLHELLIEAGAEASVLG